MAHRLTLALCTFVLAAAAGGSAFAQNAPPPDMQSKDMPAQEMHHAPLPPAEPLRITFADKSAEWTAATLAPLPHTTVNVYNEHAKANQAYSGVPLTDLLTRLGVPNKLRGKDFRIYLVAVGSDGYEAVYSLGEVTPDVHDGTVLVADAVDGKPLPVAGPLQLVATGEKRPARWVRSLVAIRVLTAE